MALTKERQGQIALAVLEVVVRENGLELSDATMRKLGSLSQKSGVPKEELTEFVLDFLPRVIGNTFGYNKVSLTFEEPKRGSKGAEDRA